MAIVQILVLEHVLTGKWKKNYDGYKRVFKYDLGRDNSKQYYNIYYFCYQPNIKM